jgi:hypothetical protein
MSAIDTPVILCGACQRKFSWKPELAGKRVKCKCGEKISVPMGGDTPAAVRVNVPGNGGKVRPAVPGANAAVKAAAVALKTAANPPVGDAGGLDGLLALAEDADRAAAAMPIEVMEFAPDPVVAKPMKTGKAGAVNIGPGIPLGYQRGQTAREKEKVLAAAAALVDPVRDIYAPLVILAVGFLLSISYFIVRFHLGSGALAPIGIGVVVLTAIKAALLIGFALVAATPLGVSFGNVGPAILKLAAVAVFTDGVIYWVDMGMDHLSGGASGGGFFSFGFVGFPVALGLYWGLMIYLFSMDPGDSWMVVALLSVFDRVMRWVILFLLLETVLSWGGVVLPAVGSAAVKHSAAIHASALSTEVDDLKTADALVEAKAFIQDGHQGVLLQPVKDWYAAGCPNVWFSMSGRDINMHRSATGVIVELPQDKASRAKCYEILNKYYTDNQMFFDPLECKDNGEDYMEVRIQ